MTNAEKQQVRLEQLEREGFDASYIVDDERIKVKCSQCAALAINGVACHETGCRNQPRECRECGDLIPRGERCECMDGELRDGDEGGYGHA